VKLDLFKGRQLPIFFFSLNESVDHIDHDYFENISNKHIYILFLQNSRDDEDILYPEGVEWNHQWIMEN
jgi:hypothetical protein